MGVLNTNVMVFLPLMIFLIEGVVFFNVSPLTNWALMLFIVPFPNFPAWGDVYGALIWILALIEWPFLKLIATIAFVAGMFQVPFSLMQTYPDPIMIMFHVGLMLMMTFGILFKIRIAGSGVEGE